MQQVFELYNMKQTQAQLPHLVSTLDCIPSISEEIIAFDISNAAQIQHIVIVTIDDLENVRVPSSGEVGSDKIDGSSASSTCSPNPDAQTVTL